MTSSNDKAPRIFVLVCVRRDDRLVNCLGALRSQTYPIDKCRVVVVENDEKPHYRDIVRQFGFEYNIHPTPGIGAVREFASKLFEGDILAITDADCIPTESWLESIISEFSIYPNLGVLGGPVPKIPNETWIARYQRTLALGGQIDLQYLTHICHLPYVVGANAAYNGRAFIEVGGFNSDFIFGSDVDIAWRIQKLGLEARICNEMVVYHDCRKSIRGIFRQFFQYSIGHALLAKVYSNKLFVINTYPLYGITKLLLWRFPQAIIIFIKQRNASLLYTLLFDLIEYAALISGGIAGALRYKTLYF